MNKKKVFTSPNLDTWKALPNDDVRNRCLLEWLSDDQQRAELYELITADGGRLTFPSRDTWQRDCDDCGLKERRQALVTGYKDAELITKRSRIEDVLRNREGLYSSRVYAELGGGSFMLALDPKSESAADDTADDAHAVQRHAYAACFAYTEDFLIKLSRAACDAAAIMGLRAPDFDLAAFAEQAAVRFCQKLMGYSFVDYRLLELGLHAAYRGLVYQVFGRHFVTDPTALPEAKQALARLLARTSALIDAYAAKDEDALKGCDDAAKPNGAECVMERLAKLGADLNGERAVHGLSAAERLAKLRANLNGEQRAVLVLGAAVGTVGNVQAAACVVVKAMFADGSLLEKAHQLERDKTADAVKDLEDWKDLIHEALRDNPPIPFLPRLVVNEAGKATGEVLLALGGGTRDKSPPLDDDQLIWGVVEDEAAKHHCAGQPLAWPLIVEIVRQVLRLPGLAQKLDPEDASVIGLKKRWGFACESYPLTFERERRVTQSTLNVPMRLKSPVKDNADRVREVIRSGAPRIEEALRGASHVHFAWFELIESDTVLVLHTVYDGPFSAYIQHFALKVGDLFDALFECIESPPPMPVKKFPNDFVAHIQRFNRAPAAGYFFSAYPGSDVAHIVREAAGQ
jgi:hypothetical protein